ncbi:MAG: hypothetical protein GVY20_17575 [Bacteroidetes bacterium]|jgi:hypothetical protein|nr:hypothetical protein [Bacteroidota bacterium]
MNSEQFISDCVENCFKYVEDSPKCVRINDPMNIPGKCVLIGIDGNKVNILKRDEIIQEKRLKIFIKFLKEVISKYNLHLHFRFILNTFDEDKESEFPLFQFSRQCSSRNHLVVPDPHLVSKYLGMRVNNLQSFEEKIPKIVFRGSDTGAFPDVALNERIYFCKLFKEDDRYDFKISRFFAYTPDLLERQNIDVKDIWGNYMSQEEQAGYRYIGDINGNTIAWDRNCWALPLNSVLIKFQREKGQKYETWYSNYLYKKQIVPICSDQGDVEGLRGREHEIISRQKEFSKFLLTGDISREYFKRVLCLYNEKYHS